MYRMSSEADHPRQRTVAELLAQHGDVNATGHRRRRRAAEGSDESDAAPAGHSTPAVPDWQAVQRAPDRAAASERVPPGRSEPGGRRRADREPAPWDPEPRSWQSQVAEPAWDQRQQAEPQPWDSELQGWDSGRQPWEASDRDPQPQEDPWAAQPPAPPARGRSSRYREPEPWESGPQAWNGRPPEPEPPFPPMQPRAREPRDQPRDFQPRDFQPRDAAPPDPQPLGGAAASPVRERPTDHIPRVRGENPSLDVSLTRPIQPHRPAEADGYDQDGYDLDGYDEDGYEHNGYHRDGYDSDDDGPPTMIGAAPAGAEEWHQERTGGRRGRASVDEDGGPPTEAAAPLDFDEPPAGLGGRGFGQSDSFSDGFEDFYGGGQDQLPPPPVPDVQARDGRRGRSGRFVPEPDGLADSGESEPVEDDESSPRKRFTTALTDSAGQAWAAVIAQWIAGAVGGAALWVGFRFLWRSLPVVALAAAALVTVGLVVVVRALLRNNDMRTTLFAVLVGLLLTASPAILVLMGR